MHLSDLTARNLTEGMMFTIVTGAAGGIEVQFAPGQVILRLPNHSYVDPATDEFGGIKVMYDYQPHDDPADRAAYRQWIKNSQDPENRRWFCSSVSPALSLRDRKEANRNYIRHPANTLGKVGNLNDAITP